MPFERSQDAVSEVLAALPSNFAAINNEDLEAEFGDVLNIYLYIKALTSALMREETWPMHYRPKYKSPFAGRVSKKAFEKEFGLSYSDARGLFKRMEFPYLLSSDNKGFQVLLPQGELDALKTRKRLKMDVKMMSVLPYGSDYEYDLRRAFLIHSEFFPGLYSSEMMRTIERKGVA